MPLPITGTQISINQVQVFYGYISESNRSLSFLGANDAVPSITVGSTVALSATFGGAV